LQVLALFRAPEYQEVSLSEWLVRTPPALVTQHFNIDPSVLARFPQNAPGILPV
jgi:oxalate decarboxylase